MGQRTIRIVKRQVSREARAKLGSEMELIKDLFIPKRRWFPLRALGVFLLSLVWPRKAWEIGLAIYVRKGEYDFVPFKDEKPSH